jgi:hypothetical protein
MIGEVEQHVAFDSFLTAVYMIGPVAVVHKFENGILQRFEHSLVGTLDLFGDDLDIAPQLLAESSSGSGEQGKDKQKLSEQHFRRKLQVY